MASHPVSTRIPGFLKAPLNLQFPLFEALGLDLRAYYRGTLNLSIAPAIYQVLTPYRCFRDIKWCGTMPPEDFSFFRCKIGTHKDHLVDGYVYYPHPETKPDHFQPPDILEVITKPLPDIDYGTTVILMLKADEIKIL